jgi:ABC-type nitrate/sulfonate/bicarbonate transport system substrate-binding protein
VTRALHRAQRLIHNHPDAAVQAVLDSGVPDLVEARVEAVVDIYSPAVSRTPLVSPRGLVRTADLFTGRPVHPDFTQIDVRDYIDNRFAWLALVLGTH